MDKHLGGVLNCVSKRINRSFCSIEAIKELDDLTGTNGNIIIFIGRSLEDIFQKDIEKKFSITRSTASKVLSLMEKKDLIRREKVSYDARLNRIVLTDKGIDIYKKVVNQVDEFDSSLKNLYTEEELNVFFEYLDRVYKFIDERGKKND